MKPTVDGVVIGGGVMGTAAGRYTGILSAKDDALKLIVCIYLNIRGD